MLFRSADMLNDRVLPFFEAHEIPLLRILTGRSSAYCGNRESHEYALYLNIENVEHNGRKPRAHKPTASVNAFIKPFRMSSTRARSGVSFITRWSSCRWTWTPGSRGTTASEHIQGNTAMVKPPCRRLSKASSLRTIDNWIGSNRHPIQSKL